MAIGQRSLRSLHSSSTQFESSNKTGGSEVGKANTQPGASNLDGVLRAGPGTRAVPTWLDKRFLLWFKYYKSAGEIPAVVDGEVIHRVRSLGRIRINIGFLILTAMGGGLIVYLGKSDAAKGITVEQQNLDWHKGIKEEYERSKK